MAAKKKIVSKKKNAKNAKTTKTTKVAKTKKIVAPAKVAPPKALAAALKSNAKARTAWDAIAPSHKKEYARWIDDAKQDQTRERRVALAVEMLASGTKTPDRPNDAPAISLAPLSQKLHVNPGMRVVVLGAPKGFALEASGADVKSSGKGDVVLAFAQDTKALAKIAPESQAAVRDGGSLWIAFPKKSSSLATDLSRDAGWDAIECDGWTGVSIVAVDDTWSAARFTR